MKVSIIVTTYNWESALKSALVSIARQTKLPHEVIVADDGSKESTRAMILEMAKDYPVTLKHSWQEDTGFRLARSRNLAIAAATGDYIIILDGDMVVDRHFVKDHMRAAKRGFYAQGSRILMRRTSTALKHHRAPHFFSKGIAKRRYTLRIPLLAKVISKVSEGTKMASVKACNQGWWRRDLLDLNGFDERFIGWGREDKDIVSRAYRMGLKRRDIRFAGLATHIFHPEAQREGTNPNDLWFADNSNRNVIACEYGIDRHIKHFEKTPLPDLRSQASGARYAEHA
ncbi:MAG: glycosyltransferase family 2 protein [Arenimonas sp.]